MKRISRQIRTICRNPQNALFLIGHRLASEFSFYLSALTGGNALPPEAVNIYPTDRCNLKCSMCFERLRTPRLELEIKEWFAIIEQLKRFKPRIHISGGEPFVYPAIGKLIAYIKKSGLFLAITTNGTFLSDYAEEIVRRKVNLVTVSIDGPAEIHDTIRGVKGSFDRIINGLALINKFKKGRSLPSIRINSMVNLERPAAMFDILKIAYETNAESVQFLHPFFLQPRDLTNHRLYLQKEIKRDLNYWQGADIPQTPPKDLDELYKSLCLLANEKHIAVRIFPSFDLKQLTAYYRQDTDLPGTIRGRCRALWNTMTILPSGEVESCPDYIIGDCKKESILKLWNNSTIKKLRGRIKKRGFFSVCKACCFFYI